MHSFPLATPVGRNLLALTHTTIHSKVKTGDFPTFPLGRREAGLATESRSCSVRIRRASICGRGGSFGFGIRRFLFPGQTFASKTRGRASSEDGSRCSLGQTKPSKSVSVVALSITCLNTGRTKSCRLTNRSSGRVTDKFAQHRVSARSWWFNCAASRTDRPRVYCGPVCWQMDR
jgi:hypothetical protein